MPPAICCLERLPGKKGKGEKDNFVGRGGSKGEGGRDKKLMGVRNGIYSRARDAIAGRQRGFLEQAGGDGVSPGMGSEQQRGLDIPAPNRLKQQQ